MRPDEPEDGLDLLLLASIDPMAPTLLVEVDHTFQTLTDAGWRVVIVWEHDDPQIAAVQIEQIVRSRSLVPQGSR
jgi:hypothetical protein